MLMAILVSETWSSPSPICYEPTSGLGPPLLVQSCIQTGMVLIDEYPLDSYSLVHRKPPNSTFIQCPLKIEKGGCLFTMDYIGATRHVQIDRKVIVDAILVITANCVTHGNNADGGEILDKLGNHIWIKYILRHPDKLTGNNATSLGDTQLNGTYISPTNSNASLSISGDNNPSFMVPSK